jgi:hypothetical protein
MNTEIQQTVPILIQAAVETLDEQIQGAIDKIIGEDGVIQYQPKSMSSIAVERPNETNVAMNNKRVINMANPENAQDAVSKAYSD